MVVSPSSSPARVKTLWRRRELVPENLPPLSDAFLTVISVVCGADPLGVTVEPVPEVAVFPLGQAVVEACLRAARVRDLRQVRTLLEPAVGVGYQPGERRRQVRVPVEKLGVPPVDAAANYHRGDDGGKNKVFLLGGRLFEQPVCLAQVPPREPVPTAHPLGETVRID